MQKLTIYLSLFLSMSLYFNIAIAAKSQGLAKLPPSSYLMAPYIAKILKSAKHIRTSDNWFDVIKLPNNVYAFDEPGHQEDVASFLIIGQKKYLLYDTGMGIASIKKAIEEVLRIEHLPNKELIVVNSHSHIDHIGGNSEFESVYIYKNQWAVRNLVKGLKPNTWTKYYNQLTGLPKPPSGFNPKTFSFPGVNKKQIHYLKNGDTIDLGDLKFKVIITYSHTPDSIVLYEPNKKMLFTGDVFGSDYFLVRDMDMLERDLMVLSNLSVKYSYNTHGDKLIATDLRKKILKAVKSYQAGRYIVSKMTYAGFSFLLITAGGFHFGFTPCLNAKA